MEFQGEGGVTVTDEMLNAWADAAERGEYPGDSSHTVIYSGRPPLVDSERAREVDYLVKLPPELVAMVDARAAHAGLDRSEFVRFALQKELATV